MRKKKAFLERGFQRRNDDYSVFKDTQNGSNVISTLFNVQLEASSMVRRMLVKTDNMTEQFLKDAANMVKM